MPTATLIERIAHAAPGMRVLLARQRDGHRASNGGGSFDNRPSWDNKTGNGGFDNRPTWDNWAKK
ncbi:multiple cyclophane-containing RiPP AmcA [Streptoalloteichus hindustanus]|uniref:multiple cyclophane-containing RiPP AmcA n=1 Tax=Streptoalloteichus hindustanus TaxID=2017 RepID=UPI00389A879C